MKKLFTLFFFVVCFFNSRAQLTCCDTIVPTFYIDLTGRQTDSVWTSPPVSRLGFCCSVPARCVQFILITDSNTCGFIFSQPPVGEPGAYSLRLCCGVELLANDSVYLSPGIHSLAFCKPGTNFYQYHITSITSCTGTAPPDSCALNCSLIAKTKNDSHPKTISVYPNPANDKLTVQLSETPKDKISFQIYDVTGREVSPQLEITNHKSEIDISSLQAGVYFLRINEGETAAVKRFLKE